MPKVTLDVAGYPPAKSEALSILGSGHPHAERVQRLLEAAAAALASDPDAHLGQARIKMDVVVAVPPGVRSDATNYLGGIADVLQNKAPRGTLDHLGDLGGVDLFKDDRQIEHITFRFDSAATPSYKVHLDHVPDG